jgi:hypothetical protein
MVAPYRPYCPHCTHLRDELRQAVDTLFALADEYADLAYITGRGDHASTSMALALAWVHAARALKSATAAERSTDADRETQP